jgi:hypothetical protein
LFTRVYLLPQLKQGVGVSGQLKASPEGSGADQRLLVQ